MLYPSRKTTLSSQQNTQQLHTVGEKILLTTRIVSSRCLFGWSGSAQCNLSQHTMIQCTHGHGNGHAYQASTHQDRHAHMHMRTQASEGAQTSTKDLNHCETHALKNARTLMHLTPSQHHTLSSEATFNQYRIKSLDWHVHSTCRTYLTGTGAVREEPLPSRVTPSLAEP